MNINKSTWVRFWNQETSGYISQNTAHWISKRINIMGPTAAIFGRDFELFILEEETFTTCPVDILTNSVYTCQGTLNRQSFEDEYQDLDFGDVPFKYRKKYVERFESNKERLKEMIAFFYLHPTLADEETMTPWSK